MQIFYEEGTLDRSLRRSPVDTARYVKSLYLEASDGDLILQVRTTH